MKINLAIQCIVLLACMAICSSLFIPKCRCLKNSKFIKPSLIADVQKYDPRPYCNKQEIIVTLKDGSKRCLDPESKLGQTVLEKMKEMKSGAKMTVSPQTTTASTAAPNSS